MTTTKLNTRVNKLLVQFAFEANPTVEMSKRPFFTNLEEYAQAINNVASNLKDQNVDAKDSMVISLVRIDLILISHRQSYCKQ